jgi:hypothetical protein
VRKVQEGFRATPLIAWANASAPPPPAFARDASVDTKTPPKAQVERMAPEEFWPLAVELLGTTSVHPTDWNQLARLRRLGIVQGRPLDWAAAPAAVKTALARAAPAGMERILGKAFMLSPILNGWQVGVRGGSEYMCVCVLWSRVAERPARSSVCRRLIGTWKFCRQARSTRRPTCPTY